MENLRGAKISIENLRGAKISVENLRGLKNFHHFPKKTPTGYPDLKKTGPLRLLSKKVKNMSTVNEIFLDTFIFSRREFLEPGQINQ